MYIDLLPMKSDYVFKRIFGDVNNIDILQNFLSLVVDLSDDELSEISIVDTHFQKEYDNDKYGILDVKAKTKFGSSIDIEIQVMQKTDFIERIMFYTSKMFTEQMSAGKFYGNIKRVISIIITDFELISGSDKHIHRFRLRDGETEFTNLLEINTLELGKLPNVDDALVNWLRLIRSNNKEEIDMLAEKNPEMKKAVGILYQMSSDEKARAEYEYREKARMDRAAEIEFGREEGREEERIKIVELLKLGKSNAELLKIFNIDEA
ncbi:MAG: Rpn family recombination-promoting nuclease/putative transposase [Ruminococcus sp.]|jgi:predicted transposase/invertase (TIGR01784 family)|nr:Rpn family recombination-promoting nuclease/putative transposase [Ruminococcus sp.]